MLRKAFIAVALCVPFFAGNAYSANLVTNGSFENGLSGWVSGGTQLSYLPAAVVTNGVSGCCFGEAVPASTIVGGSPDAAGTHGVYFVDDAANQTLTQSVFLTVGSYEIGFDAYAPLNGYNNPGDAVFNGAIAGVTLANYTVKTQGSPRTWINHSGVANIVADGFYSVAFSFRTFGGASADVVIDRAYIVASSSGGGITIPPAIPEPETYAMLLAGLGMLGFAARRRKHKPA